VLVAILKKELNIPRSLGEILQVLSISIFEKNDLFQALSEYPAEFQDSSVGKQLSLFT